MEEAELRDEKIEQNEIYIDCEEELEEAVEKAKSFDFETSSEAPILVSELEKETDNKSQEKMTGITRNENGEAVYSGYAEMSADKIIKFAGLNN